MVEINGKGKSSFRAMWVYLAKKDLEPLQIVNPMQQSLL